MTQASTHIALNGSRLIRLLSELAVSKIVPTPRNFGGRFGQLFALSDSISLSEMHGGLAKTHFESRKVNCDMVTQEFLASQKKVIESITSRFISNKNDNSLRNRFPALRADATPEQLEIYEAYQGFYVTLQREMDREIQYMLSVVRDAASGLSTELAQLVVIDQTLSDTLSSHSRKLLAQIPKLLSLRFEYLRQQYHQTLFNPEQDDTENWLKPGGWLDQFRLDMHQTALAELELRLLPAIGLLEAIQAEQSSPANTVQPTHSQPTISEERQAL